MSRPEMLSAVLLRNIRIFSEIKVMEFEWKRLRRENELALGLADGRRATLMCSGGAQFTRVGNGCHLGSQRYLSQTSGEIPGLPSRRLPFSLRHFTFGKVYHYKKRSLAMDQQLEQWT